MPTYDRTAAFGHEWRRLSAEDRAQFMAAVGEFVADLKAGHGVRASLGVKRFHSRSGDLWEFRWGGDRRALFHYGASPVAGEVHIIWEHVGTHAIYKG